MCLSSLRVSKCDCDRLPAALAFSPCKDIVTSRHLAATLAHHAALLRTLEIIKRLVKPLHIHELSMRMAHRPDLLALMAARKRFTCKACALSRSAFLQPRQH